MMGVTEMFTKDIDTGETLNPIFETEFPFLRGEIEITIEPPSKKDIEDRISYLKEIGKSISDLARSGASNFMSKNCNS